ncbi:Phage terminase-like protein, large subunit, contains N-terminal HTH domain [Geosporobacter subterraneus DSM 17957]|uniref:Phage terminase-like protein, large subunit, contains N-terminal HTH domain n=1 Tax=Geosporobacter subterraneus DSM 17957 TaxID=1121919 RepID=A0A1M6DQA4_9FIRM|nr:terminase TerL endonuclease subunit [Geosporobacter subterraneus]SHI75391.1 Phage terminase-like protein, large subunit, contains N-terminal HTH domain [Geosporobacter subterraneus DSM 17957]
MHSYLIEYYEKCKSGEILIGRELMMQLEMLMEDMNNPIYRFDTAEAHKRIQFIEKECKHSISPFAGHPFLLELWQKAYLEAKYSFYMMIEGKWLRRFNRTLLVIGRKNGKTTLCAADGLAEFFCGNTGTNILCASNDYEQAGLVFDEINNMREESPKLAKVTRKNIKGIFMGNPKQKKKKGKFSYQNKAKIKKLSAKTGAKEGKNVDKAIVDEVHEMKDNSLVAPIVQSTSTKDEAMVDEITTEGFTEDGYLDEEMKEARKVLKGELHRPRRLYWLYTQDSETEVWQDRKSWVKSNPNLGVAKKWHYLDDLIEEAKTNSATRAFMLAKDFNFKQGSANAWLQDAEIINAATFNIEDFRGAFYIAGNDFMETTDLCASKLLLMKPGDKTVYFYSHYWIPEAKLKLSPDDVDYRQWERDGYLTIVEGNSVDSSVVADWQFKLLEEYDLKPFKSGYDNRFAKDYINRFEEIFGKDILLNVPQDAKVLNNPMRRLEADLRDKLVNYNNCYGDMWCFKNTGIKLDALGRMMPCKMHTTKRIDGTAAAVVAYAVFDWHKSEFLQLIGG